MGMARYFSGRPAPGPASALDAEGRNTWLPGVLQFSEPAWAISCEELNALEHPERAVVTGAFGYTGGYVARHLIHEGVRVRTLSRRGMGPTALGRMLETAPLDFSDPDGLRRSMEEASVPLQHLLDTVRTWPDHLRSRGREHQDAAGSGAKQAGVGRIVHFSVANASSDSRMPYFWAKGQVEEVLMDLRVPYAIIRPTLVFGVGDLLFNNIAWALRRFPFFPVYGGGDYPVQPVYVEDVAAQAVAAGSQSGNSVSDAAGPDTLSFTELLRLLASAMGVRSRLVHTPASVGLALTGLVGLLMRDVVLTRDEVGGLMAGLLTSEALPTGTTRLGDWLVENVDGLGRRYVSELRRNYRQ